MTSPIPLDLQIKITEWRRKAAIGELTLEEMKEAVVHLRAGRMAASVAAQRVKRPAGKKIVVQADDLLGELEGL